MTKENNVDFSKLKSKIADLKKKSINEAQTKEWLIKPFFQLLGWDFSDPNEIIPEDNDLAGKRCDYTFCIKSKKKLLVEAKQLGNILDDEKMIFDKLNYCAQTGIPLLIITNGNLYRIYYSELKGIGKNKLLDEFTLTDNFDVDLIDRLSKTSFEKDVLLTFAKNISLYTNIKNAIEKLFQSTNKIFIGLINNYVKDSLGHKFGEDEIDEALKQFSLQINSDIDYLQYKEAEIIQIKKQELIENKEIITNTEDIQNEWTIDFQFKDKRWKTSYDLYIKLIKQLKSLKLEFNEKPTKFYIGLISEKANFCQIHGQKNALKIWLNLELSDILKQASLNVRDVTNIGHWGMGNIECYVKSDDDFEWISELIKKAYDKEK